MIAVRIDRSVRHTSATDRRSEEGAEVEGPDIAVPMLPAAVPREDRDHRSGPYLISGASRRGNSAGPHKHTNREEARAGSARVCSIVALDPPRRPREPLHPQPERNERD